MTLITPEQHDEILTFPRASTSPVFIAGGAVLAHLTGAWKAPDLDIFILNTGPLHSEYCEGWGEISRERDPLYELALQTTRFKIHDKPLYDIIYVEDTANINQLFCSFDIGLCRVAWDVKSGAFAFHRDFWEDWNQKTLTHFRDTENVRARLKKYQTRFPEFEIVNANAPLEESLRCQR